MFKHKENFEAFCFLSYGLCSWLSFVDLLTDFSPKILSPTSSKPQRKTQFPNHHLQSEIKLL
ncbi:unnamed protein product, partial [Arabidopsis halleri]